MIGPTDDDRDAPGGPLFWSTAAVGLTIVIVAVLQLAAATSTPSFRSAITFILGAGLAHDVLLAPAVVLVGALTLLLPPWTRTTVRVALAASLLAAIVSWPEVRGYGASSRNPSVLPLDYTRNLLAVLGVIWAVAAAALVVERVRRRV